MSSNAWGDMKWGDQDGDDAEDDSKETKQGQVFITPPDKDGVKTITELSVDGIGKTTKTVRKVKQIKKTVRINKHILARRKWSQNKYGDCIGLPPGIEENVTYTSHEVINLQLKPRKREDVEEEEDDDIFKLKEGSTSIVVCRNCGETGHWTLKCPQRDTIVPKGQTADTVKEIPKATEDSNGRYVPPSRRGGAGASSSSMERDDSTTIRVTNISADTTEDDLRELFRRFGHTSRIYLAKDRQTGESRGFAFINYSSRDSAQDAIDRLNGHGYDNLILHVEFAKPRDDVKPDQMGAGGKNASAGWTMQGTR